MLIKLFDFSTFYVVFGFLTYKKEKIDQNQLKMNEKNAKTKKQISTNTINKQTTKQSHKA